MVNKCFRDFLLGINMCQEFEDKNVNLNEGDFIIVPRGVMHRPNAEKEVEVLLFEPASILNMGNVKNEFTKNNLQKI